MTEPITAEVVAIAQRIEAESMANHEDRCQDALRSVCLELAGYKATEGHDLAECAEYMLRKREFAEEIDRIRVALTGAGQREGGE